MTAVNAKEDAYFIWHCYQRECMGPMMDKYLVPATVEGVQAVRRRVTSHYADAHPKLEVPAFDAEVTVYVEALVKCTVMETMPVNDVTARLGDMVRLAWSDLRSERGRGEETKA